MTTERDFCAEANCKACCCRNVKLNGVSDNELQTAFPDAKAVAPEELGAALGKNGKKVYYASHNHLESRPHDVLIVGRCPNLGEDSKCLIYEKRPAACKNFLIGSDSCNNQRAAYSLPVVNPLIVKEARRADYVNDLKSIIDELKQL